MIQTTSDLHDVISTTDATTIGILIALVIAFGTAIVFLMKHIIAINKEYISELRASNDAILQVNNSYNEYAKNMLDMMTRFENRR